MTYKEIVDKYLENATEHQMHELNEMTSEYIEKPYDKETFLANVEGIFSKHLSMAMAKDKVKKMINDDGTIGEHWNEDQVSVVWKNAGYSLATEKYNLAEIYYVLNMVYSDYYKMYKDNVQSYIMHAYLFLNDKDFDNEEMSKTKWYACHK